MSLERDLGLSHFLTLAEAQRILADQLRREAAPGLVVDRILANSDRRREWGEALWTAPDLFTPPIQIHDGDTAYLPREETP